MDNVNNDVLDLLRSINDRLLVSEFAKEARSREGDRNALRQAILDEMARKDFQAALVLVDRLSTSFGYVREAEEFRDQISLARHAELERPIGRGHSGARGRCWSATSGRAPPARPRRSNACTPNPNAARRS